MKCFNQHSADLIHDSFLYVIVCVQGYINLMFYLRLKLFHGARSTGNRNSNQHMELHAKKLKLYYLHL